MLQTSSLHLTKCPPPHTPHLPCRQPYRPTPTAPPHRACPTRRRHLTCASPTPPPPPLRRAAPPRSTAPPSPSSPPPPPPTPYRETHAGLVVRPSLSPLPLHIHSRIRPQVDLPLESLCPASQLAHCRSPRCLSFQVVLSLLLCGAYPLYRCFRRCCMVSNNLLTQKRNCTLSAQTCETWPAKRKYARARRPEVRWLRKYANFCDKYRTRFTNSPPQTRDSRVPIPIFFCSPPVASLIASFQRANTCVSYKGFR